MIGAGVGDMKGRVFRIGSMGDVSSAHVNRTAAAMALTFQKMGYPVDLGRIAVCAGGAPVKHLKEDRRHGRALKQMSFEKGTLIYVNYTAKVKDTGEAIESTVEDEAKKLNIYDPERRYEPRLVSVGEDWVLKGLDEEIAKMDTGERKTVELSPEKAWGERDPTLLRMIPIRKFGEKADEMRVGDVVEVDNRLGVVRFIGSGRAQVDFNHRLAGKTLVYDVEIVSKVETDEQKIRVAHQEEVPRGDRREDRVHPRAGDVTIEIPEAGLHGRGTSGHQERASPTTSCTSSRR